MNRSFAIDSNIAIYAFSSDPKNDVSRKLLQAGPRISVQLLNEFANVLHRKNLAQPENIAAMIEVICNSVESIGSLNRALTSDAVLLIDKFNFSYFDSLMVAAAMRDDCEIIYSEDMQNGLNIDNRLTITNPFLKEQNAT